jgi:hypothetical protein
MSEKKPLGYIEGGYRCALRESEWLSNWWVGTSPRNGDDAQVEGEWEDWVNLAHQILAEDAKRQQNKPPND